MSPFEPMADVALAQALRSGRAALVVVDVQNDFCHPDGAMARLGADVSVNVALVGPVTEFAACARRVGAQLVFVQLFRDAQHSPFPARGVPPNGVCVAGSWGAQLVAGLAADAGDLVVHKSHYSAFLGTGLEEVLRGRGVDIVVVVGTTANVCVDTTVRDAALRGFTVIVLADLVGHVRADLAECSLRNLGLYFADVRESGPLRAALAEIEAAN